MKGEGTHPIAAIPAKTPTRSFLRLLYSPPLKGRGKGWGV